MNTLLKVVGAILVLLIIGLVLVSLSLNTMIRSGVETFGPQITGTSVTLDDVDLSLLSGKGNLEGVTIGNPPGFQTPDAFHLKNIRVHLEPRSTLSDKLVIHEIVIDGPEITYEGNLSGSNISRIRKHVEAFSSSGGSSKENQPKDTETESSGRRIEIDQFVLKNAEVHVSAGLLKGKALTIPLPDITLRNIGRQSKGATLQEAASEIFSAVNKGIVKTVAGSGGLAKQGLKQIEESVKNLKGPESEAASKVLQGVKGLLGN